MLLPGPRPSEVMDPSCGAYGVAAGKSAGASGEGVCQLRFADDDCWRGAAAVAELPSCTRNCNSADHGRNGSSAPAAFKRL